MYWQAYEDTDGVAPAYTEWPIYVSHFDGVAWGDGKAIEIHWDGSGSGPTHDCIDNVSTFVYVDGGGAEEGMLLRLRDSGTCGLTTGEGGGLGLDNTGADDSAIVFARHIN